MADRVMATTCRLGDDMFEKAKKVFHKKLVLGSKAKNYKKAADLFDDAAETYKRVHLYEECGHAYLAKAEALMKANEEKEAAEAYSDAADAYESMSNFEGINAAKMVECLGMSSRIAFEQGAVQRAAKIQKDLGERLLTDKSNKEALEAASRAFYKAAEYFSMENSMAHVNDCYEKAATSLGYKEDWKNASRAWQKILFAEHNKQKGSSGTRSMIQFKANKYIFRSVLCQLAGLKTGFQEDDLELVECDFDTLNDAYGYNFDKNREYDLLRLFITLFREKDLKKLKSAIRKSPDVVKEDEHCKFLMDAVADKLEKASKHIDDVDLT